MATEGPGPLLLSDEPLDGKASGCPGTLATIVHLKAQLQRARMLRLHERGGQRATLLVHALAPGFDPIAPRTLTTGSATLVREARAAGATGRPRTCVPCNRQQKAPSQRAGSRAFAWPCERQDTKRVSPVRLIGVQSEGQGKRAQNLRRRPMRWLAERLQPRQGRVGPPGGRRRGGTTASGRC